MVTTAANTHTNTNRLSAAKQTSHRLTDQTSTGWTGRYPPPSTPRECTVGTVLSKQPHKGVTDTQSSVGMRVAGFPQSHDGVQTQTSLHTSCINTKHGRLDDKSLNVSIRNTADWMTKVLMCQYETRPILHYVANTRKISDLEMY